ncbi:phage baseplate assembly protein V [Breoghania sp. L-A4]|uniref:phage baseplate assembly protein V n=1 Tax=Breoghania sp. L-A4 TaxID=2304600 RepID=UPI0020BF4B4C|nr:phage baseplate assembly protein V [Breoghania sp. L-A4]
MDLYRRIAELERRGRNAKRTGTVSEVDHAKGLARVMLSEPDGVPFVSPWMPWKEVAAGDIKSHIPPSVGQQVTVSSENGDLTDGEIDMSVPSTANPRPHDGPEAVITKGSVRIEIADALVKIDTPKAVINSDAVHLGGEGGPKVARLGDNVLVGAGSSAGMWPIVEGSSRVFAAD